IEPSTRIYIQGSSPEIGVIYIQLDRTKFRQKQRPTREVPPPQLGSGPGLDKSPVKPT
ncbi:hypothetical protein J6590_101848, partial [Homalodisca vitripennis]